MNALQVARLSYWPDSWIMRLGILVQFVSAWSLIAGGMAWGGILLLGILLYALGNFTRRYQEWEPIETVPGMNQAYLNVLLFITGGTVISVWVIASLFSNPTPAMFSLSFALLSSFLWIGLRSAIDQPFGLLGLTLSMTLEGIRRPLTAGDTVEYAWLITLTGGIVGVAAWVDVYRTPSPRLRNSRQNAGQTPGWLTELESRFARMLGHSIRRRAAYLLGAEYWSSWLQRILQVVILIAFAAGAYFFRHAQGAGLPLCVAAAALLAFTPQSIFFINLKRHFDTLWNFGVFGNRQTTLQFLLKNSFRTSTPFMVAIVLLMLIVAATDMTTIVQVLNIALLGVTVGIFSFILRARFYRRINEVQAVSIGGATFILLILIMVIPDPSAPTQSVGDRLAEVCGYPATLVFTATFLMISVFVCFRFVPKQLAEVKEFHQIKTA